MYNLPFLQVAKKRRADSSSSGPSGTAKKQRPASQGPTADIDDLNGIRMPAGGATGAAGKRPAVAPKQGRATEEELELLGDLKDRR